MTAPTWPSTDIHTFFGPDNTPKGLPPQQLFAAFGRFLLESFIGNVALAFGGIDIAGWKPFDFLADWGQARIDEASANFILATNAGGGADTANTRVSVLEGTVSAGAITGGVSISDGFGYVTAAHLPSPPYTTTAFGPGAGTYGPQKTTGSSSSGADNSLLVWKPSGSSTRTELIIRDADPLGTDNGFVSTTVSKMCDAGTYTYLIGRAGAASTHVRAAFSDTTIAIQTVSTGNTFTTVGSPLTVSLADRDVIQFWFGTQADATLLWVVRNGVEVISPVSDTSHTIGSGQRICGIGGMAISNGFFGQFIPAKLNGWTYSDQEV